MKRLIVIPAALAFVLATQAATISVPVSANVVGVCKVISSGSVVFGDVTPDAAPATINATVTQPQFWCTKGVAYTITDDLGVNASGGVPRMANGSEFIPYTLNYTTSGTGLGVSTPISLNVTATVLGADYANVSAGTYTDTVTFNILP